MVKELIENKERFYRGESDNAYAFMGAHPLKDGEGWVFRVWAPNAKSVRLAGDFNFWNTEELFMQKDFHGVWEIESRYAKKGDRYQYYTCAEMDKLRSLGYKRETMPLADAVRDYLVNYRSRELHLGD